MATFYLNADGQHVERIYTGVGEYHDVIEDDRYMKQYRLDDNKVPIVCSMGDPSFAEQDRKVENTEIDNGIRVSTVFLMFDHNYGDDGDPILFETMIFPIDNYDSQDMERYCTWDEAVEGHWRWVKIYGGSKPITLDDCKTELDEGLFKL